MASSMLPPINADTEMALGMSSQNRLLPPNTTRLSPAAAIPPPVAELFRAWCLAFNGLPPNGGARVTR
jgi:hypothetical protein